MAGFVDGLTKGSDGLWRYRIVVNGVVYTGCTNEVVHRLAVIWLSIKRGELGKIAGGEKPRKMITLSKALEIWEQEMKTEVTDRYIGLCKQAMDDHFKPLFNRPLDTIAADDISQLLKTYQSDHYDPEFPKRFGGRNQLLTYWRSVKRVMISKKILTHWDLPKDLKGQKVPKRLIPQEHQDGIMAIIDNRFGIVHGVAFRLGLFIGLRSIEVNRATWRCVDWTRKKWVNFQTKGLESIELPIPPQLMEALTRLRDFRGGKVDPNAPICPLGNGEQAGINTKIVKHALEVAAKEVAGCRFSSHDLRATFITTLHRKGIPIKVIQHLARHADISTTLSYIILEESDMEAAMEKVYGA